MKSEMGEIGQGNSDDFGSSSKFVLDQRGYSFIFNGIIEELKLYVAKSGGRSGIHLNHKVIEIDYKSNQVKCKDL